jgi:hypothetical protein
MDQVAEQPAEDYHCHLNFRASWKTKTAENIKVTSTGAIVYDRTRRVNTLAEAFGQ